MCMELCLINLIILQKKVHGGDDLVALIVLGLARKANNSLTLLLPQEVADADPTADFFVDMYECVLVHLCGECFVQLCVVGIRPPR